MREEMGGLSFIPDRRVLEARRVYMSAVTAPIERPHNAIVETLPDARSRETSARRSSRLTRERAREREGWQCQHDLV